MSYNSEVIICSTQTDIKEFTKDNPFQIDLSDGLSLHDVNNMLTEGLYIIDENGTMQLFSETEESRSQQRTEHISNRII